jgi:lysozyme
MKTNEAGLALIKEFEGLRLQAYQCSAKVWTIGYGHTSAAGEPTVRKGLKISKAEADEILRLDLAKFENAVAKVIKVPVSENEFAAMVSLAFNIGPFHFAKSSVARFVNAGKRAQAAKAFASWNKVTVNDVKKTVPGLVRRRAAEAALFLTPDEGEADEAVSNGTVEAETGKPAVASTTNIATAATGLAGITAAGSDVSGHVAKIRDSLGISPETFGLIIIGVIIIGGAWVMYQRHLKSRDYGV